MFNVKAKDVVVTCTKEDLQNGRFLSNKEFLIDNHVLTFSSKMQMVESVFNIDNAFHLGDMTLYCDSIRPASEAEKQEGSGFAEEGIVSMGTMIPYEKAGTITLNRNNNCILFRVRGRDAALFIDPDQIPAIREFLQKKSRLKNR